MSTELATTVDSTPDFMRGMYCSIEADTQEQRLDIYDAVSSAGSLDDMVGKTVSIENVIIQPVEVEDEKSGEMELRNRIVLVEPDGTAYACMSTGVETSIRNLFAIVGMPPWAPALTFEVTKKQGRNGYKFTTLQRVR